MSKVLIAYSTGEGQTAKICRALSRQFQEASHEVELSELQSHHPELNVQRFDAIIVAASVHAGKHQKSAAHFVTNNIDVLRSKPTAFVSVGLAVVATEAAGRKRADEQVSSFLKQVDWEPDLIETLGGAFRYSEFSAIKRWIFRLSQRLFRKDLDRQGWPDVTADNEFTDWDELRRFGTAFAAKL
ncbi:MAG: flavodoxin domain-containing protein [Candidatus Competibacteraceae bacterium]|jgi:menaquinone-dependent protoporphyrinogen oxidase|nr:flavodoxin domain-containing protein [Candidatus Competibacteraceae bacterium]